MNLDNAIKQKAGNIRLLAMDVDGVLTDGKIIYDNKGIEIKEFFVQDGLGLVALKKYGIKLAIITGRKSLMVERRARELGIDYLIQGQDDKLTALASLAYQLGLHINECAYVGDDLPDVRAIKYAGFGVSVPNGCTPAQTAADYVTKKSGGNGAIREVCEVLLLSQGHYYNWIASFE